MNGNTVAVLLDSGNQVTHVSLDYCQAMDIPINAIEQLVNIEGAGRDAIEYVGFIEADLSFPMGTHCSRLRPSFWSCQLQNIRRGCL